jgi:hypothetical protein
MEMLLSLTRATNLVVQAVRVRTEQTAKDLLGRVPTLRGWMRLGDEPMLLSRARSLHEARLGRDAILRAAPGAMIHTWAEAAHDPAKLPAWVQEAPPRLPAQAAQRRSRVA